ncbi:hypothetical protein [Hominifimenecus sp. rT4P-3]|uniref:hypothetical protein n=1 Tax=Hominifimenecus sp. rT4P-3 TaxID=3242979 RepID=UPI003DA23DA8
MKGEIGTKITDIYYRWKDRRGKPAISEAKKARIRAVYPEKLPEQAARELDARRLMAGSLCFLLAGVLSLLCGIFSEPQVETCLARPEGEISQDVVDLELTGSGGSFPVQVKVTGRRYSDAELEQLFQTAEEEARKQVLGENSSLDAVWGKLNFRTESSIEGMRVSWSPQETCLVDTNGEITTEVVFGEGKATKLDLTLRYEAENRAPVKRVIEVPIVLVEPSKTPEEAFQERVEASLRQADREGRETDILNLPEEINGEPVTFYRAETGGKPGTVLILGILAGIAVLYWEEQKLKEAYVRRNRELALDYGELVGKLNVLIGAGLPVRRTWERIVKEAEQKAGKKHYLYEEMALTLHAMEQGISEDQAYREFGKRCGLPPYLRLGSLLEANGTKGTKGLTGLLEKEAADAFLERLQLARKQGEEVNAKLLLPMLLLFALVLILLMVPAFLAF